MSLATVTQSTSVSTATTIRSGVFTDLPLINRFHRLNIIELNQSDKQIVNELVYRWCRILTRNWKTLNNNQVLIIDMIGSVNFIRLATILKRERGRMKLIKITSQSKINPTFVTLTSYLRRDAFSGSPKLVVIYHDEYFIIKTMEFLNDFLKTSSSQVLLVVPRLDRQERDILSVLHSYQILKCDFRLNRREIRPAPPETSNDSYHSLLNQVTFMGSHSTSTNLPEKVHGELREDGLHLHISQQKLPPKLPIGKDTIDGSDPTAKRIKMGT